MSILSSLGVAVAGAAVDILLKRGRSIAGVIPQVVIEEEHTDELMITQHPVERSANISDHAVKQPARLTMRCGWSESSGGLINSLLTGTAPQSPRDVYTMLRSMQDSKQLVDVVTGKRSYKNMLISRLGTVTDAETENCLIMDIEMQEVFLVSVGVVDTNPQNPEIPAQNGGVTDAGTQQAQPVVDNDLIDQAVADSQIEEIP